MRIMFKNSILIAVIVLFTANLKAQNCAEFINGQSLSYGYELNSMSKSGAVRTGKKYKFVFTLNSGKVYRFSFYASSSLNNDMEFILTDQNSGTQILFLPGEVPEVAVESAEGEYNEYGEWVEKPKQAKSSLPQYAAIPGIAFKAVLKADYYNNAMTYPFFEFKPANAMNLEVTVDIKELPDGIIKKGCLGIMVQDRAEDAEFQSL